MVVHTSSSYSLILQSCQKQLNTFIFFFVGGKNTKQLVDRCIAYIGENAAECFKTNSFLNLNKDALVKLISSDYVSIALIWYIPIR